MNIQMIPKYIAMLVVLGCGCNLFAQTLAPNPWGQQPYQAGAQVGAAPVITPSGAISVPQTGTSGKKPTIPVDPFRQGNETRAYTPTVYGQYTSPNAPEKPFANYQAPSPISPYMNLYRTDNYSGIDNYNLYVRPALEAEQKRVQMQREVHDMQVQQMETQNRQTQQATTEMVGGGAVYGNLNSGLGATYGAGGLLNLPPAPQEAPVEKEKTEEQDAENTDPANLMETFNPYLPSNAGLKQYPQKPTP